MTERRLVLFDIDKTLIDVLPIQVEAFHTVFRQRYGTDVSIIDVEYAGVPYKEIVENLIKAKVGTNPSKEEIDGVSDELFRQNKKIAERDGIVVLPGVADLLKELHKLKGICLGVLTGNTRELTGLWLELSKLSGYFPEQTWSVGTEWHDRADGIILGKRRCEEYYKAVFERVITVGDSDKEIMASKSASRLLGIPMFVVSVATGDHPAETLKRLGADTVVRDFSDYKRVAKQIFHL